MRKRKNPERLDARSARQAIQAERPNAAAMLAPIAAGHGTLWEIVDGDSWLGSGPTEDDAWVNAARMIGEKAAAGLPTSVIVRRKEE